jgi:putative flippase GtrA
VAGSIAVATHLVVLVGLTEIAGLAESLASGIGFCCATPVNYYLQHRYVFSSTNRHLAAFSRYLAVTLAVLGLNVVLFHLLLKTTPLHYVVVQIVVIGVLFVVNFLVNRSYTFAPTRA